MYGNEPVSSFCLVRHPHELDTSIGINANIGVLQFARPLQPGAAIGGDPDGIRQNEVAALLGLVP